MVSAMVSVRFKYRVEHGTRIWDRRFKDCRNFSMLAALPNTVIMVQKQSRSSNSRNSSSSNVTYEENNAN